VRKGLSREGRVVEIKVGGGKGRRDFDDFGRGGRAGERDLGEGKQRMEKREFEWLNWREVVGKRT
jgi:hypothetical protein